MADHLLSIESRLEIGRRGTDAVDFVEMFSR